tara:strand:- start:2294 stop:3775 length:1482 start_codon:yes stop_codon:yes gene_type:complete
MKAVKKSVPYRDYIQWKSKINSSFSYSEKKKSFTFLNITHNFSDQIDWNYDGYGKLWAYNLNYFDFLNQKEMSKEIGVSLINNYIENDKVLKDGKEAYPISLRGINWVKFLSENKVKDSRIDKILLQNYYTLLKNLEYHLLGNHLLENAFSLLFGAYYFQDGKLYSKSKKLLTSELEEQILNDGAHFELSPMYHQIILSRLLDSIHLIKLNNDWKKDDLLLFFEAKASLMVSWLKNVTYSNGQIPMVNDTTYDIAPQSNILFSYAKEIGIADRQIPLSDSGYRKININSYELLIDVGNVGPDYQPGHAHSDTFNFELTKEGKAIFVDVGISTYEKNLKRQEERSTHSHNTVKIGSNEQSQVWGGFRVANRAKIIHLIEKNNFIEASHNGYLSDGYIHKRSFLWDEKSIILNDKLNKPTNNNAKAYFHLHHKIKKPLIIQNKITLKSLGVCIEFGKSKSISIESYELSLGFNKTTLANRIVVGFDQILETKISI